jgi:hypothetical protein
VGGGWIFERLEFYLILYKRVKTFLRNAAILGENLYPVFVSAPTFSDYENMVFQDGMETKMEGQTIDMF